MRLDMAKYDPRRLEREHLCSPAPPDERAEGEGAPGRMTEYCVGLEQIGAPA
jgi:hypothetical protein